MKPRTTVAILAGKAAGSASRLLGRGGGTAIAGLAALRVDPGIVRVLAALAGAGAIAITGTNGKTTTSLMLNRIALAAGLSPLHNRSGSNMMRGVAAMLVDEASLGGTIADASRRLAVLEVDEATLPEIVEAVQPRVVVFTNLFRDQLDRYGEVDTVARAWERALAGAERSDVSTIVLNADDPAVAHLGRNATQKVLHYGIDDMSASTELVDHASDFRNCLVCGNDLSYTATFYGHLGHWRCPSCGNARPQPEVRVTRVATSEHATEMTIATPLGELAITLPLAGLYNAYNALAATAGALALGLPKEAIVSALDRFTAAFGRQERFSVEGRDVEVLLGKNPTGLNQVLRIIAERAGDQHVIFFLNDGIADGRDISWIWDADYELVRSNTTWIRASGNRAEDLALRLKYAGFGDEAAIEHDATAVLRAGIAATPAGGTLFVVPTYTAMLEVRELLAKWSGQKPFWEDA